MSTLRIASFNVENLGDDRSSAGALAAKVRLLRPQLERLDADVVCLQEVDAHGQAKGAPRSFPALDALLADTPYAAYERASTETAPGRGPRDKHNLVILSRWPITELRQYANDLVEPPLYRTQAAGNETAPVVWDRPILHAAIELGAGRRAHVFNVHLRAPLAAHIEGQKSGPFVWKNIAGWAEGFFMASIKRSGQALEARLAIERVFDAEPEALIAIVGDFNAEEHEVPLRIVLGDSADTGNGALAHREMGLIEHTLPASRRFTVIHAGRKLMLDHMLVSRQLMAHFRALEVHNEMLGDELVAQTLAQPSPESYHAPIVAEFDIG